MSFLRQLAGFFGSSDDEFDDEPSDKQASDFSSSPMIAMGLVRALPDCEEIPSASGPFGECETNPIPANGPVGESVYLSRLRSRSGVGFMWHRVGSTRSPNYPHPLDVYEIVAIDASEWRTLYFAMYHRRRSTKAPSGLSLRSWRAMRDIDRVICKTGWPGHNQTVENFPMGLPAVVARDEVLNQIRPGFGSTMAKTVQGFLDKCPGRWARPVRVEAVLPREETVQRAPKTAERASLTPEDLGGWVAGQQRVFFHALLEASQTEQMGLPPLELSPQALSELSCNAYAAQVATVAFTYHELLDDSRYLSGGNEAGANIDEFLTRMQAKAGGVCMPYVKVGTPEFDPFAVAGCIVDVKYVLPRILLYYGSLLTGLDPMARAEPEAVRFAAGLVEQMGTTNPLAGAIGLAYFFAFKDLLTKGGRVLPPDTREPDEHTLAVIIRTWPVWGHYLLGFQERLLAFADGRTPEFR